MPEPDEILFTYIRNSRTEGWRVVFLYFAILVLWIVAVTIIYPDLPVQNPTLYRVIVGLFILVGIGVGIGFALPGILRNEEFSFIISPERVSCISPKRQPGASFTLRLEDILAVEKHSESGKECWYILTHGGKHFVITPDFGNPVTEVVRTLVRLRPDLEPRRF